MNVEKAIAGVSVGAGGLLLIYLQEYEKGMILLVGLLSFFVGDWNGQKRTAKGPSG